MTTYQQTVNDLCSEIYDFGFQQIVIDLVQDTIEELITVEARPTRDDVGAAAYDCSLLLDVFNPKFEKDIDLLTRLKKALDDWSNDIENTNIILGIPKEK